MAAVLEIANDPALKDQTAFNLAVWEKVLADPFYHSLEHRIETNAVGQIIMSPPPAYRHGEEQAKICKLLWSLMEGGSVITECPISTPDGVRAADVAWISDQRKQNSTSDVVLTTAPEVCVEVLSPSNTKREMEEKKSLFFAAGADEVWFCSESGELSFFLEDKASAIARSSLCPEFPAKIEV
ncbi:MAG: Uma2 family endonuclease [Verrucomicrobiota bacterium]